MASAFERIADIIAENSEVPRDSITPESHVIEDLGIDSLDFLDIVFAIDKAFGIKVPVETWTQEVNAGSRPAGAVLRHEEPRRRASRSWSRPRPA